MLDHPGRTQLLALVAVAAAVVLSGCTGGDDPAGQPTAPGSSDGSGSSARPGASAAGPGVQASTFPVPAGVQPSALPSLGSRAARDLTYTLNAVRRVSPQAVVVEGTLTAKSNTALRDLAEPGFRSRDIGGGKSEDTYEISGVTLTTPGDAKVYLPLRDEKGFCSCSQGVIGLDAGESMGVYTYVTAPEDATSVTVTVAPFGAFPDIPVTS